MESLPDDIQRKVLSYIEFPKTSVQTVFESGVKCLTVGDDGGVSRVMTTITLHISFRMKWPLFCYLQYCRACGAGPVQWKTDYIKERGTSRSVAQEVGMKVICYNDWNPIAMSRDSADGNAYCSTCLRS
jgi:hypothetical protein